MQGMEISRRQMSEEERTRAWRAYWTRFAPGMARVQKVFIWGALVPLFLLLSTLLLMSLGDVGSARRPLLALWIGLLALFLVIVVTALRQHHRNGKAMAAMRARIGAGEIEEIKLRIRSAMTDPNWDPEYLLELTDGALIYFGPCGVPDENFPKESGTLPSRITVIRLVGDPFLLTMIGDGDPVKAVPCSDDSAMPTAWISSGWEPPIPDILPFPGKWETAEKDFIQYLQQQKKSG